MPAVVLPITPDARWHADFSTVVEDQGRVVSASDLQSLADATGTNTTGPEALTDALGRKFWRFTGSEFLSIAQTLTADGTGAGVFGVVRCHRVATANALFSLGESGGPGSQTYILAAEVLSRSAPIYRSKGRYPRDDLQPGVNNMVPGAQLHVASALLRDSAGGGTRLGVNQDGMPSGRNDSGSYTGAEVGRDSSNAVRYGFYDVYELVFYDRSLTDAEANSIAATLQGEYGIPDIDGQLVMEGDSITQGTGDVNPEHNAAMVVTEPGSATIPASWKVWNAASSGNEVGDLQLRADATTGEPFINHKVAGENVVAVEIGRNDLVSGGLTAQQHYDNLVAYLISPNGPLANGWDVRQLVNIGSSVATMPAFRTLIRDPQFLTDTLTGVGQMYEGQLSLVELPSIMHNGQLRFIDSAAIDTTYYAGDNTHPTILGALVRASGGDTPEHGIAFGLGVPDNFGAGQQSSQTGSGTASSTAQSGFTATGAGTSSGHTGSGTASSTSPSFTATGSGTQSLQEGSGVASSTATVPGTGAGTQSPQTGSGSASFVNQQPNTGSGTQSPQTGSGVASFVSPTFAASGSGTSSAQTGIGSWIEFANRRTRRPGGTLNQLVNMATGKASDNYVYMRVGDTSPSLEVQLTPTFDLTGCSVVALISDRPERAVDLTDLPNAIVTLHWLAGDLAQVGRFPLRLRVTFPDGSVETWPSSGALQLQVSS